METDDIDNVLCQFNNLQTDDRENMIRQLQEIIGEDPPRKVCVFLLEMTNWNLQDAIGAYYDHSQRDWNSIPECVNPNDLGMQIVEDRTVGQGMTCQPWQRIDRVWRIRNCGNIPWPQGTKLKHVQGHNFNNDDAIDVQPLQPGEEMDILLRTWPPLNEGIYMGIWKLHANDYLPFGENIYCIAHVAQDGMMTVTQQMHRAQFNEPEFDEANCESMT